MRMKPVPVLPNAIYSTRSAAIETDKAGIELHLCDSCGHVFNAVFDPERVMYAPEGYANPLGASAVFQAYQTDLVDHLVDRFDLTNGTAFEIGAGDASFLAELIDAGMSSATGLDPSATDAELKGGSVRISARELTERDNGTADLLVMAISIDLKMAARHRPSRRRWPPFTCRSMATK